MIEESFWNEEIRQFKIPVFKCPICNEGLVLSRKENVIEKMTKNSSNLFDITGDERDYHGSFTSISKCNNPNCGEIMTIVGETKLIYAGRDNKDYNEIEDYVYHDCKISYTVNYLNPPVRLINFPANTPREIVDIIIESFRLFWIDENSCANKIRIGLETIMTHQKVPKYVINKNRKRQLLNLDARLVRFRCTNPTTAEYFLALKWIGNEGSHSKNSITKNTILEAYEILEHALNKLYDKKDERLSKRAKQIIKMRGKIRHR